MNHKFVNLDPVLLTILIVLIIGVLITLMSNLFTCVIFFSRKNRESRAKFLLGNIAFSDIIYILVFIMPLMVIMPSIIEKNVIISHIIQSITNFINATTLYVTSITMTVIALDRYYVIVFTEIENPLDKFSSKILLLIIWILSLLLSTPFLVTNDIYYFNYKKLAIECLSDGNYLKNLTLINEQLFKHISRKSRFILQYVIPIVLISYFYSRIIYHLFRKRNSDIRISNIRFQKKVWKTTKMLIAVVVFTVCNFAFYFTVMKNLLNFENKNHNSCVISTSLSCISYIIFITSCLLNPIIYWWMSSNFRKDFKRILLCIRN